MKTVCLCNSFRFYKDQLRAKELLKKSGFEVFGPYPYKVFWERSQSGIKLRDLGRFSWTKGVKSARRIELKYFEKIDMADCLYVISTGGYVGKSVSMEIGYAYAKGKPIYSTEPIEDWAPAGMVKAVLSVKDFAKEIK